MNHFQKRCAALALVASFGANAADHEEAIKEATAAATSWLSEVDAGQFDQSWDDAAPVFQATVNKSAWAQQITASRGALGALKQRDLVHDAQWTATMPGAPDGQYVVLHFSTVFANKQQSVETVIPTKTKDGRWHVTGYFVR